jgi:hypothetical protein
MKPETQLAPHLDKYIREKHNTDECTGFIAGFEKAEAVYTNPKIIQIKDIFEDDVALMLSYREDAEEVAHKIILELGDERFNRLESYDWLEQEIISRLEQEGFIRIEPTLQYIEED